MTEVYQCPVHGLLESPRFFGPPYTEAPEYERMICPINLSTNDSGITDDVCHQVCEGPFTYVGVAELPDALKPRWFYPSPIPQAEHYVPPSVQIGNRRTKIRWWLKGCREAIALWLAPWLGASTRDKEWTDIAAAWRELVARNKRTQDVGRALLSEAGPIPEDEK